MGRVLMLFTVLCSVLFVETAVDIHKKKIMLRKFEQCRNFKDMFITWDEIKIGHDPKTKETTYSLKVNIHREIKDLAIVFSLGKCDASGNPDSCEYVLKDYNVTKICEYMVRKNQAWSPFVEHFDKPLKCPLKPGMYISKDTPINTDFMKYVRFVTDGVWKIKLLGYDKGAVASCVELEMQITSFYNARRH